MAKFKTLFSSTIPIDCHILKGRLESDGITCFIYDEDIIWVHPFYAVAISGSKIMVPTDQFDLAQQVISLINFSKLSDENGEYEIATIFNNEIKRQNKILELKFRIREDASLLNKPETFKRSGLDQDEIKELIELEKKFQTIANIKTEYSWKQFWYELFDSNRRFFKYLRPRPVEYYLEKEIVENYHSKTESKWDVLCPECNSDNVSYGYAIDFKWDILYLILSLLVYAPFPLIRKNYHCFDCGANFKFKKEAATNEV